FSVEEKDSSLWVNGKEIKVFAEKDPSNLPWKDLAVDLVVESTGFFTKKDLASKNLEAGAKKVLISAPAGSDLPTVVYNVNHKTLKSSDTVISSASCTT
ncbi:glyceraldehyde 3-phosphate dehydrogenase NAD-binding domain-containing protein, partial [Mycoplasmopsis synoviae]